MMERKTMAGKPIIDYNERNTGRSALALSFKLSPLKQRKSDLSKLVQPKRPQFHQSPMSKKQPSPHHMIGLGYEHAGLALNTSGESGYRRGVFVTSHRNPILALDHSVQGPSPPPFNEYLNTGLLLSEPGNSLGAIRSMSRTIMSHGQSSNMQSHN